MTILFDAHPSLGNSYHCFTASARSICCYHGSDCQLDIYIFHLRPDMRVSIFRRLYSHYRLHIHPRTIIMRRGFMLSGTDLLGVTFTSLFALPSVRLLLPGMLCVLSSIQLVGFTRIRCT